MWFLWDTSVKCKCELHGLDCFMFVQTVSRNGEELRNYQDVMVKLLEWLALAPAMSKEEHAAEATEIKIALGLKPRRR